ncbi:hypothetical protein ACHAXN_005543 [Cyclotella atomus]
MTLSILTDTFCRPSTNLMVTHHYYTSNEQFEQSLDIYHPTYSSATNKKPIVVLVVGSAWLGHRSFVYNQTSWWNSSGPKAVARLGYTCVCIRHRGSFPGVYSALTLLFVVVMIGLLKCCMDVVLVWMYGLNTKSLLQDYWGVDGSTASFVALSMGVALMKLGGRNAASFGDMQNDVMDALAWFDENRGKLLNYDNATTSKSKNSKIVFGGYSSGGHVAATVVQQPNLWKERNLPGPDEYCSTILYISPVLCTKPYHVDLERHLTSISLKKVSTSLSEDRLSNRSSSTSKLDDTANSIQHTTKQPPSWLTDHLIHTVFGYQIPSPIHTHACSPNIPHLFIGCNKEMFGLDWLDLFFASRDYNELLVSRGVDSKFVGVDSDHWNILGSWDLLEVLERELRLIKD